MAAPVQAQYETLFNQTFAAAAKIWFHGRAARVWRKSEFQGSLSQWKKGNSYVVLNYMTVTFDDAGTERFADSTLTTEVANPIAAQPDAADSGFFYILQHETTGKIVRTVHESDLLQEASMETYVQGQVTAFIS